MRDRHPRPEELQAFVDDELAATGADRIRAHCRGCPDCQREVAALREVQAHLAADHWYAEPHPVWPRVAARLARRRAPLGRPLALATAVAALAGIVLGLKISEPARFAAGDGAPAGTWATPVWPASQASASLLDVFVTTRSEGP